MRDLTRKLVTSIVLMLLCSNIATAQNISTIGVDFHVMFLRNDVSYPISNNSAYFPTKLKLVATGNNACSGTITSANESFTQNFTVTPGQITEIEITKNNYPDKQAGYSYKSGFVEDKGLHVTATDSISLYAVNYCDGSFDITNVLPTPTLGDEYIIQNYKGCSMDMGRYSGSSFVIVATEENTTIDITPTALTGVQTPGASSQSQTFNAGQTITITLNAGQSYQLISWGVAMESFDGTYIKARDNKKIAVFKGNGITAVPGIVNGKRYGYKSHLYEQSIPTQYWGNQFIVTQSLQIANDRVKVTALNNDCTVKINGTLMKTLAARETYEFEIVKDTDSDTINAPIDKVYGTAHYIETSEPASVFLYMTSREYSNNTEQIGDPSMVLVTPVEQQTYYVTFSTFNTDRVNIHHANIVTKTSDVNGMTLDGTNIASDFRPVPGNTDYSYARIDLEHGTHTLQNPTGGFSAHIYGFGDGWQRRDESYAYTVGASAAPIIKQLFVNNTLITAYDNHYSTCSNKNLDFYITTNYEHGEVIWDFGDGTTSSGNEIVHSYDNEGEYLLKATIERENATFDTLTATIIVNGAVEYTQSLTICPGSEIVINGVSYDSEGSYTQNLETETGCDSIVTLNMILAPELEPQIEGVLSINAGETTTLTSSEAEAYLWNTGETTQSINVSPTENTTYSVTITDANGCRGTSEVVVTVTDGTGEFMNDVKVYPNPTKKMINIEANGIINIRITDMLGQTLFVSNASCDKIQIDMSNYAIGNYFMQICTNQNITTHKVVKN